MDKNLSINELEALLAQAKQSESNPARQALEGQLNKMLNEPIRSTAPKPQPKVVRDSFTLPENDYQLIPDLQDRALDLRLSVTKGEVLRAGLHALERMSEEDYLAILKTVEKLKPGRRKGT